MQQLDYSGEIVSIVGNRRVKKDRIAITTPERLIAWRLSANLTQDQAAAVLRCTKRRLQHYEAGVKVDIVNGKPALPARVDDLARLYDMTHRKKKTINKMVRSRRRPD